MIIHEFRNLAADILVRKPGVPMRTLDLPFLCFLRQK